MLYGLIDNLSNKASAFLITPPTRWRLQPFGIRWSIREMDPNRCLPSYQQSVMPGNTPRPRQCPHKPCPPRPHFIFHGPPTSPVRFLNRTSAFIALQYMLSSALIYWWARIEMCSKENWARRRFFMGLVLLLLRWRLFFVPFSMKSTAAFVWLSCFHSYIPCLQA